MGTNYYLRDTNTLFPDLHIGKQSVGWGFAFRDDYEISAWIDIIDRAEETRIADIYDEYGNRLSFREFLDKITLDNARTLTGDFS